MFERRSRPSGEEMTQAASCCERKRSRTWGMFRGNSACVCLLLQYLVQSCVRGGRSRARIVVLTEHLRTLKAPLHVKGWTHCVLRVCVCVCVNAFVCVCMRACACVRVRAP